MDDPNFQLGDRVKISGHASKYRTYDTRSNWRVYPMKTEWLPFPFPSRSEEGVVVGKRTKYSGTSDRVYADEPAVFRQEKSHQVYLVADNLRVTPMECFPDQLELIPEEIKDEHHTIDELYEYRMLYNAMAANTHPHAVFKSWRHSDGELCFGGGWFVVYMSLPTGWISNHYKAEHWDLFHIQERDTAPEYDGHTPQEAARRMYNYLKETP